MTYKDWEINKIVEAKYQGSLRRITSLVLKATSGLKTAAEIESSLQSLAYSKEFADLASLIAKRFITMANVTDARTWRAAARGGNRGREIYRAMLSLMQTKVGLIANQRIVENASLIRTLPLSVSQNITSFVAQQTYKGLRASEIADQLQNKVASCSHARANLIARTESSKAMTELTRARAEDLGIDWYIWRTSEDSRVRSSHEHMEGVLVRWSDPPAPEELIGEKSLGHYNAGGIFNCRCFTRPLVSINNVKWPCKVYYNGGIQRMTKEQFTKIA